ncbi:MAG: hypothetical protein ABIS21_04760, partial [Acidimicrobiales bacterium]
ADLVTDKLAETRDRIRESLLFVEQLEGIEGCLAEEPPSGPCNDSCACNTQLDRKHASVDRTPQDPDFEAASACTLDAAEIPGRIHDWRSLMARATGREWVEGGVRVRFGAEDGLAATVAGLAQAEQACCAHFDFAVGIGSNSITLEVRAPFDVEPLVDSLFGKARPVSEGL